MRIHAYPNMYANTDTYNCILTELVNTIALTCTCILFAFSKMHPHMYTTANTHPRLYTTQTRTSETHAHAFSCAYIYECAYMHEEMCIHTCTTYTHPKFDHPMHTYTNGRSVAYHRIRCEPKTREMHRPYSCSQFYNAAVFNQTIGAWNTNAVTSMPQMV